MQLPISSIVEDAAYQARDTIDKAWVESLVDVFDETPPVLVYALPDGRRVLVDGFHRMAAARQLKRTEIQATIKEGTETDAMDAAAEANAHATQSPLKQKERRRLVVAMAGRHPEWPHEKIAHLLGLSHDAVRLILGAEKVISSISTTNIRIPDTTARAMTDAPPATYTPLAEAATASKWKPADTKEVARTTALVTAPQDDTPALPVETAAHVLHLAAEKEWTPRETQAALHVAAQSDDGYVERLASGDAIPVVPNDAGVYGALPETIERFFDGGSQDPTAGQLLSAMVKAYGYVSLHDPKDAARTLTAGTAAHYRDELPRLVTYVEKVIDALAFSRLELMS